MIRIYRKEFNGVWFAAGIYKKEVYATTFSMYEGEVLQRLLRILSCDLLFQTEERPCHLSSKLLETLSEIFDGKTVSLAFRLAVDHLPSRIQNVLTIVSLIPVGYLTTYSAISRVVSQSPRFVGRAIASNPFILLVPCHRVVQADFSIGGFALGKEIKLGLLKRENRGFKESVSLSIECKVLPVFPVKTLKKLKTLESRPFM